MNITEFSIKKPVTITMLFLVVAVLGILSLTRLGLDLLPDITFPVISVVTTYTGVSSEDIENTVTKPLEEAVASVGGIKNINSVSLEGISVVLAEFNWGTNLDTAAQDIREKIDFVADYLPEDAARPMVMKFDASLMPLVMYGVSGELAASTLFDFVDKNIKTELEQVDGVASVLVYAGGKQEVRIVIDAAALQAHQIPFMQVVRALGQENQDYSVGYIEGNYREFLVRSKGKFVNLSEIENTVLAWQGGTPIYVKDVASVKMVDADMRGSARMNGEPAALLMVTKESGKNTVLVSREVRKCISSLKERLSGAVEIATVFDQADIIERIIKVTGGMAVSGALLAVLILYIFLRHIRPTLVIALAIPLSLVAVFIPLHFLGYTLNFITLIGFAIGGGMMVDNAIVVIENIYRHIGEGKNRREAALVAPTEVGMAITASTLTTIAVFVPLFYFRGIAGMLFQQMGVTISVALLASLLVALSLVPMLAARIFRESEVNAYGLGRKTNWFETLKDKYQNFLRWAISHNRRIILTTIGVFLATLSIVIFMKKEFFPTMDVGMATLNVRMPLGTKLAETEKVVGQLENFILEDPDILVCSSYVGIVSGGEMDAAMGSGPRGPYEAMLILSMKDKKDRKRSSAEIIDSLRRKASSIPGAEFEFTSASQGMVSGGQSQPPVVVKLMGQDRAILKEVAEQVSFVLSAIPGITDVESSFEKRKQEFHLSLDREKLAAHGTSAAEVAKAVESVLHGVRVGNYFYRGRELDMKVYTDIGHPVKPGELGDISLVNSKGQTVRVEEVSKPKIGFGPLRFLRENQKNAGKVTANLAGRNLGLAMQDVGRALKKIALPEGYLMEYGGEAKRMQDIFVEMAKIFIFALLLVYMIMAAQFESLIHPFAIMFTVPFAIIGVIWSLAISGKSLALPSLAGILVLSGVIVNNGIVMIDYINHLRRSGLSRDEAIIKGAVVRMRPVIMTAATTVFALLPLAFGHRIGSEARSIAAVAIIGGLVAGTFLTLIVLPSVYRVLDIWAGRWKERLRRQVG